jgi:hypothetical protein
MGMSNPDTWEDFRVESPEESTCHQIFLSRLDLKILFSSGPRYLGSASANAVLVDLLSE